jgi:hypothetical protein
MAKEIQAKGKTESIKIPGLKLSITVGLNTPKNDVLREVDRLCNLMKEYVSTGKRLGLLLGRVMALVKERKLYMPEFENFEDYKMHVAEEFGLSRSTVSEDMQIARYLPKVTPEQARLIPTANLALVARASKRVSDGRVVKLLEEAQKSSIIDFRRNMEKRGLIAQRVHPGLVKLVLKVTKATRKDWYTYRAGRSDQEALSEIVAPERTTKKTINAR